MENREKDYEKEYYKRQVQRQDARNNLLFILLVGAFIIYSIIKLVSFINNHF